MHKIADTLSPLKVPIDALELDDANARIHGAVGLGALKHSLSTYGQQKPVVYYQMGEGRKVVIAGNGTVTAARALGWMVVAAVEFVGTFEEARKYSLADNRTAEFSTWDKEELASQLVECPSLLDVPEYDLDSLLEEGEVPDYTAPPSSEVTESMAESGDAYTNFVVKFKGSDQEEFLGILREVASSLAGDTGDHVSVVDAFVHVARSFVSVDQT